MLKNVTCIRIFLISLNASTEETSMLMNFRTTSQMELHHICVWRYVVFLLTSDHTLVENASTWRLLLWRLLAGSHNQVGQCAVKRCIVNSDGVFVADKRVDDNHWLQSGGQRTFESLASVVQDYRGRLHSAVLGHTRIVLHRALRRSSIKRLASPSLTCGRTVTSIKQQASRLIPCGRISVKRIVGTLWHSSEDGEDLTGSMVNVDQVGRNTIS